MKAVRWLAVAIAIVTVWDPAFSQSRFRGPAVAVTVSVAPFRALTAAQAQRLITNDLERAGFDTTSNATPDARVLISDRAPRGLIGDVPIWAINMAQNAAPNVRIRRTSTEDVRLPGQSLEVRVVIEGVGVRGATTDLQLEQDGISLASARHVWRTDAETWSPSLRLLPPMEGPQTMRVRAIPLPTETSTADNSVDIRLPSVRSAVRVLSYDVTVSWPATFFQRSLEGEAGFSLSTLQRASEGVATRAGAPPEVISERTLEPYDVVSVGGAEHLTRRQLEILRWFAEIRGGVVVLIPDTHSSGDYASLVGVTGFDHRVLKQPIDLKTGDERMLRASELIVARHVPNTVRPLAIVEPEGKTPVFVARRGAGAVVFFGALDAWRFRATDHDGFARFWRRSLTELARTIPPRLSVEVEPSLARVGERVRVRARLRGTELKGNATTITSGAVAARAVGPAQHLDAPIRLWPTVEPGIFEGQWTIPAAGEYDISISSGQAQADAVLAASSEVARGADEDSDGLALLATASGGEMRFPARRSELVGAMRSKLRPRATVERVHPMRSPWWLLPFVAALGVEWGWRRTHGAP